MWVDLDLALTLHFILESFNPFLLGDFPLAIQLNLLLDPISVAEVFSQRELLDPRLFFQQLQQLFPDQQVLALNLAV